MFPNLIVVVELHDVDARPSNREEKYVYKERDVQRGKGPSLPFRKHDTTSEAAALRPLAIYGNGLANGPWSRSCFTIFVQPKKRKKSIWLFFFCSPRRNDSDGVAQRKGCRRMEQHGTLFYFRQNDAACSCVLRYVENRTQRRWRGRPKRFLPSSLSSFFLHPFRQISRTVDGYMM